MPAALPDRDGYFTRWSALHGGYDPRGNAWVRGWLTLAYAAARPLASRRVPPDAVTLLSLLVTALALPLAAAGGRPALVGAALVVVLSGLLDNLDGAVAALTDRATRWGYVLDSVTDRVADGLYLVALWLGGAPAGICVVAAALMVLLEYTRARATGAGMTEIGVVTVWERGTRVAVTAVFLGCAALLPFGTTALWVSLGAAAWCGLGAVGCCQLLVVVRRRLR